MMNAIECAKAWKLVIKIYDDTITANNPKVTANEIVKQLGKENTINVFATVAKIKSSDGRISSRNRERLSLISKVDSDSVKWERGNPMLGAGLDHIHTAHIDNLITEILKIV